MSCVMLDARPGDVVVTEFRGYQHWSLVSDRFCSKGLPMLISATRRNGTVREEPWNEVTQGEYTYITALKTKAPLYQALNKARSQIGLWKYSIANENCEHFINWTLGCRPSSKQVISALSGAALGIGAVKLIASKPNIIKYVVGAMIVAGIAVQATKAIRKYQ